LVFSSTPAHAVDLQGSGATFVAPLLEACKAGFAKTTSHSFTYGAGGSGAGQRNSDAGVGDFWFSDSAYRAGTRASIIHAPVVAAPIAVMHNLQTSRQLYLSPNTILESLPGQLRLGMTRLSWQIIIARSPKLSIRKILWVTQSLIRMVIQKCSVLQRRTFR